ncbi:MAG: hypothetical protein B7Z47_04340 [Chthoniobacter sp. 12-60-6]|nr:MAG: hypothetical protein B7Z47_04340 [Chthoniobacter sp. 12-60-6]
MDHSKNRREHGMKKQPSASSVVRAKKGKRQQEGDFFQVKLEGGLYAYGRVLESPTLAFYDTSGEILEDLNLLLKAPVLFKIWVMKDVFKLRKRPHGSNAQDWSALRSGPQSMLRTDSGITITVSPINRSCFSKAISNK